MKKTVLCLVGFIAFATLQAQWVNDPSTNTFIANCGNDDGEVYLSTNVKTGDTYVQWEGFGPNGWSPTLQRLNFEGVPQWGDDGIHIGGLEFSSMSEGVSMVTTADGGVVSCFADYEGYSYAVKLNVDGSFAWGEQGVRLFDGHGFSRTELVASTDGGFWALGSDYDNSYLQYVNADGTLNPTVTISSSGYKCMFGQLTLGLDNSVFLTYERLGNGFYTNKDICLVGYDTFGNQITPNELLMSEQSFQSTYIHYVVPDGLGGGYVYIWHSAFDQAFNVYVFHYDASGTPTITDTNGIAVHSPDPASYYGGAYGTVDPITHDLIIAYEQTDATTQSQSRVYINRITPDGERLWDDGILIADYVGFTYSDIFIDAFEDGSGFSVIYNISSASNPYFSSTFAIGLDMQGNELWATTMSVNPYRRISCDNSAGFHFGQNIIVWVNGTNGGLYGQNITPEGTMGPVEQPEPCYAPENFQGSYLYLEDSETFGALLTWDAPETQPLWYQLYITLPDGTIITAEIDPTETEYFHELTTSATIIYRLIAVYEYCESDYALTPDGEDHVEVYITDIQEDTSKEIVTVLRVFSANGHTLTCKSLDDLSAGIYILQGLTEDGRLVSRKVFVRGK